MKQTLLFAALGAVALGASAQEVGRVLSRNPVVQQVAVPRQVCSGQYVQRPTTGGGAALGGLTGGMIGSGIGHGSGNAAAIAGGVILGAIVGNNVESQNNTMVVPNCVTETTYENRTVAWNVTYDYQGRQYSVQLPYDPGPTVRLSVPAQPLAQADGAVVTAPPVEQAQVAPAPHVVDAQPQVADAQPQFVPAQPQFVPAQPAVVQGAPVVVAAAPVVSYPYPAYAYPYAYPAPYYRPAWPIGLSLSLGGYWGHGHGHRGHRH